MNTKILSNKATLGWIIVLLSLYLIAAGINHSVVNNKTQQATRRTQTISSTTQLPPPLVINLEPGKWSDWKKVKGPAGAYRHFEGPSGTKVRYEDGTEGLITENFGMRGLSDLSFKNDSGGTVRVIVNFNPVL